MSPQSNFSKPFYIDWKSPKKIQCIFCDQLEYWHHCKKLLSNPHEKIMTERPTVYKTWGSNIVTRRWIITATTTAVGKIFNRWFGLIWHTLMHHFFHWFLYGFFATFFLFEGATCSFGNAVAFCYGLALPYRNLQLV